MDRMDRASHSLRRVAAGPAAIGRSSRRLTRVGVFLVDVASHVQRNLRPLPDGPETSRRQQAFASFVGANYCAMQGVELQVRGPIPRGPCLLVANHISYLDPFAIMAVAPSLAVAKSEVSSWPLIGELARDVGLLLLDRSDPYSGARVLLRARTLVERGVSVLTFPEGTTTRGEQVLPFKRGMFGLARRLGLAIVPIALRYSDARIAWVGDASFLPHFLRSSSYEQVTATLEFGEALDLQPKQSARALAERARAEIQHMLKSPAQDHR